MNIRPRCGEWLPLYTQQLRLRNLQAIHGVNIELMGSSNSRSNPQTLVYYTLHDLPKNEPFYQSEKVVLRKHLHVKWAEIHCPEILKSNVKCVCIKVWACIQKTETRGNIFNDKPIKEIQNAEKDNKATVPKTKEIKEHMSALAGEFIKLKKLPIPSDTLLFTWAVYFSGLVSLSQNTEVKCSENSLIFQMNDEYFASPELLSTESLRGQLALNYERYSASVSKCTISTPDEFTINSPQVSRSSSPVAVDWKKNLLRMSKARYIELNCLRSEVRRSYNLKKLLRLQRLQRQHLQTQLDCIKKTDDIKRLCIRCITKEQTSSSASSTASQQHSTRRTLSLLLAEQQHIDPHRKLKAQQLQLELESLQGKQRLFISVNETICKRITHLTQQLNAATISRQQLKNWLSEQQRKLHDEKLELESLIKKQLDLRIRRRSVTQHVEHIVSSLCLELRDIYPIARSVSGLYTICGVPFPTMDGNVLDSISSQRMTIYDNKCMALGASLGYVAHLIQMISVVLDLPLRNPIIHEGSRTRIVDVMINIPPNNTKEFPLYSRKLMLPQPVKYAVNLLNQNIAQLCFDITGVDCNMQETIENLLNIFEKFVEVQQNRHEMHLHTRIRNNYIEVNGSHQHHHHDLQQHHNHSQQQQHNDQHLSNRMVTNNGNGQDSSLARSNSLDNINHQMPPTTPMMHHHHHNVPVLSLTTDKLLHAPRISSQPIDIQDRSSVLIPTNQQRNCRSMGSYTDSEEDGCKSTSIYSDSNSSSLQNDGNHHV